MNESTSVESRRLDGNAAAGLCHEIFAVDITSAVARCAHCGASGSFGTLVLYAQEMGAVLRCPSCEDVVMRIVRTPTHAWLDASGARSIAIPLPGA